ncbi:MAG: radical SAM family heme chaperone HemW [Acutalibacteraceae bacterium]
MSRGLYIHIPFCAEKCAYCDFYSLKSDERTKTEYEKAVIREIKNIKNMSFDTLYIGGGTPTVMRPSSLVNIITAAEELLEENAEITAEANPAGDLGDYLKELKNAGVNRISFGLQSSSDRELELLSRLHRAKDARILAEDIKAAGIKNFSADLMLGIPEQTEESLKNSIDFALSLGITHLSCYMLKIEANTPFAKCPPVLPKEDEVCDMYLYAADTLKSFGFAQYEISNFTLPGFESRHNLHYWNCDEYLGIGPSAHSFIGGKRFYYPRDINKFISCPETVFDGAGGDFQEYAMLRLRLSEGLVREECKKRFENGELKYQEVRKRAQELIPAKYIAADGKRIALTAEGFLVSNSVISEII